MLFAGSSPNHNDPGNTYLGDLFEFHSVVPLGVETLRLEKSHATVNLMASAWSTDFEGMKRRPSGAAPALVSERGESVARYPGEIVFRVSASTRGEPFQADPTPIQTNLSPENFILNLGFQLKVFRGLGSTTLSPDSVEMIGVPADLAYDQRIYLVHFKLENVPATDRLLLELLDDHGERISRFHLELL